MLLVVVGPVITVHKITICISKLVLKLDLSVPKLAIKSYSLFIGKAEIGEEELIQTAGQFSGLYSETTVQTVKIGTFLNPLNPELYLICYLLALLAHHFLHVSTIRVKSLTLRLLMSYIYGAPILDVSRSHTTMQHSR